jgi:hypothetical protein
MPDVGNQIGGVGQKNQPKQKYDGGKNFMLSFFKFSLAPISGKNQKNKKWQNGQKNIPDHYRERIIVHIERAERLNNKF